MRWLLRAATVVASFLVALAVTWVGLYGFNRNTTYGGKRPASS
jgi:hypothetical protein